MVRVFLIGFMGTGKTTLGRALARSLNLSFCDLDEYIENRYRKTVSQIFAEKGGDEFHEIEARLLHEVSEFENIVISCGGATPLYYDNMDYMNSMGQTLFLDSSTDVLFRRLAVAKAKRPVIAGKSHDELRGFICSELESRRPFYEKSRYRYSGDRLETLKDIDNTVNHVIELLSLQ